MYYTERLSTRVPGPQWGTRACQKVLGRQSWQPPDIGTLGRDRIMELAQSRCRSVQLKNGYNTSKLPVNSAK